MSKRKKIKFDNNYNNNFMKNLNGKTKKFSSNKKENINLKRVYQKIKNCFFFIILIVMNINLVLSLNKYSFLNFIQSKLLLME